MIDNLAIGIMTSINLRERYTACKNSWVKDFDNVFLFGGDSHDDNLIRLSGVGENYSSAFLKQQLGLKYMFEKNSEFDWYSIVGCDSVLFKENILKSLKNHNRNENILFGEIFTTMIVNNVEISLFAGGAGFFISNSLMKKIYPLIDEYNSLWIKISQHPIYYEWSDVALSYMIKYYFNLEPNFLNGMFSQPPSHYINNLNNLFKPNTIDDIYTPLSFHYIKPIEMKDVYNKYKNKNDKSN